VKFLLGFLLLGKFGKILLSGGTMLLSVFVYSLQYGWRFAFGLVGLIFVHEMGHLVAARQRGLAVGAPVFIPFVGAWIALKSTNMDAETEAFVGLGGPMLGSAAALCCYLVALDTGDRFWMALAYAGFFINLFNLIPLTPLDGGRIVAVISPKLWLVGLPVLLAAFVWRPNPLLLIVGLLALPQVWRVLAGKTVSRAVAASKEDRIKYGFQYLILVTTLSVLALEAHEGAGP
jgi:Zn-dependent protease